MYFQTSTVALAALIASVQAHGVILQAVGDKGSSQGFRLDQTLPRNCTTISPCQQDSVIIRDAEITSNIVNACGRTEIAGNIDIGEETENELAAGRIATISAGSTMQVTIHQVNADGAGPYECDFDDTSNSKAKYVALKVANNIPGANGLSQAKEQDFTISVQMPKDLNCIGASTGDICTVRCRNTALAGPFGGCFAVRQVNGGGRQDGTAAGVKTTQTLDGISAQILQNQKDLPAAIAANQAAGAAGGDENASAVSALVPAATGAAGNNNQNQGNNQQQQGQAGNQAGNQQQGGNKGGNQQQQGGNKGNAGQGNNANAGAGQQQQQAGAGQGRGNGQGRNQRRASRFLSWN